MLEHAEIKRINGQWTAATPRVGITVDSPRTGSLFKRRAQRTTGASDCLLVGQLDGVRAYVALRDGQVHVVLSKQQLYPDPK